MMGGFAAPDFCDDARQALPAAVGEDVASEITAWQTQVGASEV